MTITHVFSANDRDAHTEGLCCRCAPTIYGGEDEVVVLHRAVDREYQAEAVSDVDEDLIAQFGVLGHC